MTVAVLSPNVLCTVALFSAGSECISHQGPFTNDVSIAGEGGGCPISDDRRRRLRDLYTKNSDKGGEGVQNLENLADVIYEWPHT